MVRQVSEELGVRYVLEGSVRRAGDQVRINCQLIDAATGGHLWSERYDGSMSDIFGLQDKINQKIVAALAVKLTEGERAMVSRKGIQSPAAYDEYLKGREYDSRRTKGDYVRAEACYKRAIELDPGQSLLHSALAGMYWAASNMGLHVELNILMVASPFAGAQPHHESDEDTERRRSHRVTAEMPLYRRQHDEAISHIEKALARPQRS